MKWDLTVRNPVIHGAKGARSPFHPKQLQAAQGPFVPVNCGAIPDGLLEAHLFGYQKGSFTGASYDKAGIFEVANGGTIFLDEVGEMPLPMQVKLLRALQEKEVVRVGSTKPTRVDIRLIAATNQDLNRMISAGQFRQDLYYRIFTLQIEVPALRERREDIPLLAEHFLQVFQAQTGSEQPVKIDPIALDRLANYDWPGNVRELQNVISRLVVHTHGSTITASDIEMAIGQGLKCLATDQPGAEAGPDFKLMLPMSILKVSDRETMATYLKRVKFELLQTAITQYRDRTSVAERLGLAEDTVRKQLRHCVRHRQQPNNNQEEL